MPNYSANYDTPEEIKAMSAHWSQVRSTPQPEPQPASEPVSVQPAKTDGLDRMRSEWNRSKAPAPAPKPQPSTDPIAGAMKVLKSGSPIPVTIPPGLSAAPLFPLGKTLITQGAVKQLRPSIIHRCFQRHASGDWRAVHPARAVLNSTTDTGIHLSRYQVDGCFVVLLTLEKLAATVLVVQAAQP